MCGVVLRMRGERVAGERAVEPVVAVDRLERVRIERRRHRVFLHREQLAAVVPDLRVLRRARLAAHRRIVGVGVAVDAIERLPRRVLCLPAIVLHPAAAIVDVAVLDAESAHVAFAVERDVVFVRARFRVLRIGSDAEEGSVEIVGNVAVDFAVVQRVFRTVDAVVGSRAAGAELAAFLRESQLRGRGAGAERGTHRCSAGEERAPVGPDAAVSLPVPVAHVVCPRAVTASSCSLPARVGTRRGSDIVRQGERRGSGP